MKKITESTKKKRNAAVKRKHFRVKVLHEQLASSSSHDNINVAGVLLADRITQLPDDIRISLLSRLPLREAVATSIISTSWRHIYTHIDRLKFPTFRFPPGKSTPRLLERQFSNYVKSIDRVLDLYSGNIALKEFSVDMNCLKGPNLLERWLEFALSRQVETIKIWMWYVDTKRFYYTLQLKNLIYNAERSFPGLKSLKELSLCGVQVQDLEVELLLSNFSLLESLSIWKSYRLRNMFADGRGRQVLKLKHLDISYMFNLKVIEIQNMINLVSLKCCGHRTNVLLQLSNVPKLTKFHTSELGTKVLPTVPSVIRDQLRLLKLSDDQTPTLTHPPTYELRNVKELELKLYTKEGTYSADQLVSVIASCRSLETLRVQFLCERESYNVGIAGLPLREFCPNLKELVVKEYKGGILEIEFAFYIVNSVRGLEQLTLEPCNETDPKLRRLSIVRAWNLFRPVTTKRWPVKLVINPLTS